MDPGHGNPAWPRRVLGARWQTGLAAAVFAVVVTCGAQELDLQVRDSHLTGRVEVGRASLPLSSIPRNGERVSLWVPLTPPPAYASRAAAAGSSSHGEVLVEITYKVTVVAGPPSLLAACSRAGTRASAKASASCAVLHACIC